MSSIHFDDNINVSILDVYGNISQCQAMILGQNPADKICPMGQNSADDNCHRIKIDKRILSWDEI